MPGLMILFEPELSLAILPTWWIEVPTITSLGRCYKGIEIDGVIFFDWLISRDGLVLGITFLLTDDLPDLGDRGLTASVDYLYVEDASGIPTVWSPNCVGSTRTLEYPKISPPRFT